MAHGIGHTVWVTPETPCTSQNSCLLCETKFNHVLRCGLAASCMAAEVLKHPNFEEFETDDFFEVALEEGYTKQGTELSYNNAFIIKTDSFSNRPLIFDENMAVDFVRPQSSWIKYLIPKR